MKENIKEKGEGPEYETIAALGSSCGIDDMAAITIANYHCNELGLDTISMGMTLSCAMEMHERSIIPEGDIGRTLRFGDADAVIDLIQQTAYRKDFGNELAEGSYRLASKYGHPEYSMTAKKQEFPGYDPRGAKGMGLLYATSNKGASHMAGDTAYSEAFGVPEKIDPLTIDGKPRMVKVFEDAFTVIDSAGLCVFLSVRNMFEDRVDLWPVPLTKTINMATGAGYTEGTLMKAGERIFNLERLFLLNAGFTKKDDTLPARMLEEPIPDGGAKGHVVELDQMLPEFYKERGWDENGVPMPDKLKELGIS
ncbi:MAG: aldehyde ferredoxin oxidoreductase C-terminal domain-containing protein [Anaerolineaceae bacterium]|nr:aldehyde ferredoxin oxidoreductase C-terminal domain-containing protein [Anaerolineaceae bacterium]